MEKTPFTCIPFWAVVVLILAAVALLKKAVDEDEKPGRIW